MAGSKYIAQPPNVGRQRHLSDVEKEHIICLLRAIERLPILSQSIMDLNIDSEDIRLQLEGIHQNHIELANYASAVLVDHNDIN